MVVWVPSSYVHGLKVAELAIRTNSSVSVPGIRLFEVQHEEGQEGKEMKVTVPEDTDKLGS